MKGSSGVSRILSNDKNNNFKRVFDEGIEVEIIPFTVEQFFGPAFVDLAQSALNAEHGTFSQANELQVMSSMALAAARANGVPDWKDVINQAKASLPQCREYLAILANCVKDYAGGEGRLS